MPAETRGKTQTLLIENAGLRDAIRRLEEIALGTTALLEENVRLAIQNERLAEKLERMVAIVDHNNDVALNATECKGRA